MHQSAADQNHDDNSSPNDFRLAAAVDEYSARHEAAWIDLRRRLHRHPEPSGEEFETSELIRAHLAQYTIPADVAPRTVGVTGELSIGPAPESGPRIALRADIDALRMTDRKTTDYASSVEGCAHACGHDVHTTVILAAAQMLAELNATHSDALPSARIRLIFQAAEEICKGAHWMVEDGAMEGVEAIFGTHVDPLLATGQIGICYGPLTAQIDEFVISIRGQGGHSARPHDTSDPVGTAAALVTYLYQQLPRTTDARDPSVFTIGQIHGGTAPNVIPDHVELNGSLRTIDPAGRRQLIATVQRVCEHFSGMTGNTVSVQFRNPLSSVRNAEPVARAFEHATRDALGNDGVVLLTRPSMGGEDFAVYLDHAPGAQIRLGCAGSPDWPLLHSPIFDVDEKTIAIGARVVSRAALIFLLQDQDVRLQI